MRERGLFVTVEGIDGSGKSTVVAALREQLERDGVPLCTTREPGGTEVGRAIRSILLDHWVQPPTPTAELLLYFADRAQHVATVIEPALSRGELVLADRYLDSTIAYQGYGRAVAAPAEIAAWETQLASGGLRPNLTLLLDMPAFAAVARLRGRGDQPDRFERAGVEYFTRVRNGFRELAAAEPDRFVVIDAQRSAGHVQDAALDAIRTRLGRRGAA